MATSDAATNARVVAAVASRFDATARATLEVYRRVLEGGRP